MTSHNGRYTFLEPMSIDDSVKVFKAALNYFSVVDQSRIIKVLKISYSGSGIFPLPAGNFIDFLKVKGVFQDPYRHIQNIRSLLTKMERAGILVPMGPSGNISLPTNYYYLKELTSKENKGEFWFSECLGSEYIYEFFGKSIIHLVGKNNRGDERGGTGVIINDRMVLTCRHVVQDMNIYDVQKKNDKEYKVKGIKKHEKIDVAVVEFESGSFDTCGDVCFSSPHLNDDIYVLGYPSIPLSHATPIMQKGEITNPRLTTYYGDNFFLFSAIARPGNSGGPVIAKNGKVVGIVTQEMSIMGGNDFPFFAAISTEEIIKALNELEYAGVLPVEDYQ